MLVDGLDGRSVLRELSDWAQVRSRLVEVHGRARHTGEPLLLRVEIPGRTGIGEGGQPLADLDPWDLGAALTRAGEPAFMWHDGRTGRTLIAAGEVAAHTVEGPGRFSAAKAFVGGLARRVRVLSAAGGEADALAGLPLVFGGFGFTASGSPAGVWQGWPGGLLRAPRIVIQHHRGRTTAACMVQVEPHAAPSDTAAALTATLRGLSAATRPVSIASPASHVDATPVETQDSWHARVDDARAQIAQGRLSKVVPARAVVFPGAVPDGVGDALRTLCALRREHPSAVSFGVFEGPRGAFVGATPELLIRVEHGRVFTEAVAGTTRCVGHPEADAALGQALLASAKDREEHDLVVRFITTALRERGARVGPSPETGVRRLAHVQHLHTPIEARLEGDTSVLDLADALHPTPAVAGWPRRAALAHLQATEPMDRGWYAGPVGWVGADGEGEFVVALRAGLLRDGDAHAFAGAGIVAASDPAAEWTETRLKLRALREAIRGETR